MRSLRVQLLYRTTGVVVLTFLCAAVALYWLMQVSLLAGFDAALLVEARSLASHVEQSGEQVSVELDAAAIPEFSRTEQPHFFEMWTSDGVSVARSPSLLSHHLSLNHSGSLTPSFAFLTLPTGVPGRGITFAFQARLEVVDDGDSEDRLDASVSENRPVPDRRGLTIAVARPIAELERTLSTLRWLLLTVTVVAVLGSAALMDGVIHRGLHPLKSLADSIAKVGVADLSERICLENSPPEALPVVQRLNELLARLDQEMVHEKAFSADISHELRTPLAGLETTLEVCASRPRDPDVYRDVIGKCLRVTQGMHAMVNNLLLLARAESNHLTVHTEPTDLPSFLKECWQPFAEQAQTRNLNVEWTLNAAHPVRLDREKSRLILANVLENAVTYSNDGGWLRVIATTTEQALSITISNSGCTLNPGDAPHVFERFWRGDKARSDTGIHCGLGLAISHRIAELLHGTITAEVANNVFSVCVTWPQ